MKLRDRIFIHGPWFMWWCSACIWAYLALNKSGWINWACLVISLITFLYYFKMAERWTKRASRDSK